MSTITLAEASKLSLDDLVGGVIDNIVTVNPIFNYTPFRQVVGNALVYNREQTLGDVQTLAIGGTITAKAPASYKKVTDTLTTIIGDAEINGLIIAQGVGGDQVAAQIKSKAKSCGRKFQNMMINGDSSVTASEFNGLRKIVADITTAADNDQTIAAGGALSFAKLDELLHAVKSKDGQVDFLMMNARDIRALNVLFRALGGSHMEQVMVGDLSHPAYNGVPIFRNDWIPTNLGAGTNESVVFAGNFDDGTYKTGICGLYAGDNAGVYVQPVGAAETKDQDIYRVKMYTGFSVFSELGIAMLDGVL